MPVDDSNAQTTQRGAQPSAASSSASPPAPNKRERERGRLAPWETAAGPGPLAVHLGTPPPRADRPSTGAVNLWARMPRAGPDAEPRAQSMPPPEAIAQSLLGRLVGAPPTRSVESEQLIHIQGVDSQHPSRKTLA